MSDEMVNPGESTPPKMVLNNSGGIPPAPGADPNKRKTARVDLAAAQAASTATVLKSATTRITLPTMPAAAPQGFAPKTIRLTRPGMRPAVPVSPAGIPAMPVASRAGAAAGASEAAKRQTSRIPLEAALAMPEGVPVTVDVSKTVHLKRPEADAGNLEVSAADAGDASVSTPADAPQPTQRKTIRIKRPMGKNIPLAVPRSMAVARIEAEAAQRMADEAVQPVGALWPILAAVAIVVACFLVYALAAQAMPEWGLRFPGQIA